MRRLFFLKNRHPSLLNTLEKPKQALSKYLSVCPCVCWSVGNALGRAFVRFSRLNEVHCF